VSSDSSPTHDRPEAPATVPAPASEAEQRLAPLVERQRKLTKELAELARQDERRARRRARAS
jgi:hypothetical protein